MAGIYVHIPFCRKACHYCNFHFSTRLQSMEEMTHAIIQEIPLRKTYVTDPVQTIYIGGGTPSLLPATTLTTLLERLKENFTVLPDAEITLETNPDDITAAQLASWKQAGINRLSIGIQSFFEEDLQWMNRAHTAGQAIQSIALAREAGFDNITIDLIYGTPTLTDEHWRQNVQTALAAGITHLSCYALTVEPKTALYKMVAEHKKQEPDPDQQSRHFEWLMQWMAEAGYEHYEISNFAKPGHRSRHNSSYWSGAHYAGIGPAAHSFNGHSRQWNVANNALYIKSIEQGNLPFEIEELTATQQLNEYIMTSLRTREGLNLEQVTPEAASQLLKTAQKYLAAGTMEITGQNLTLTMSGKLLADGIAADLFQ